MATCPTGSGIFSPSASVMSKFCINFVKNRKSSCFASCSPGQVLLPEEKKKLLSYYLSICVPLRIDKGSRCSIRNTHLTRTKYNIVSYDRL